jgi:hypothetical protein
VKFTELNKPERVIASQTLFKEAMDLYEGGNFWEEDGRWYGYWEAIRRAQTFYRGEGQWPEHIKQQLIAADRKPTVMNRIASAIHLVSGLERKGRTEVRATSVKIGDDEVTDIINPYLKQIANDNKKTFWDSEGFKKMIIEGAANFEYSIQDRSGRESIVREMVPNDQIMWDIDSTQIDRADATYCIHHYWVSKNQFEDRYPDLKDADIEFYTENSLQYTAAQGKTAGLTTDEVQDDYRKKFETSQNSSIFWDAKKIRIIRIWRVNKVKKYQVKSGNFVQNFSDRQAATVFIEEMKSNPEPTESISIKEVFLSEICLHEIAGNKEINFIDNIGVEVIPIKSVYCYWDAGKFWGLPYQVRDNQEELNFIHSKLMDVIARINGLVTLYEKSAVSDKGKISLKRGLKTGDTLEVEDGAIRGQKILNVVMENIQHLASLEGHKADIKDHIQFALGARDVLEGFAPKNVSSGIGLQVLRQQGITVLQEVFDHLDWFKEECARLEVELMPLLDKETVRAMVFGSLLRDNDRKAVQAIQDISFEYVYETAKNSTVNFAVEQTSYSPSENMVQLQLIVEIAKLGIPISPEIMIELSPLNKGLKQKQLEYLNQQQQAMAAAPAQGMEQGAPTPEEMELM